MVMMSNIFYIFIVIIAVLHTSSAKTSYVHQMSGNASIDCLSFQTLDLFGDGWRDRDGNEAQLFLFKPGGGAVETFSADCSTTKSTSYDLCPESDGHYIFTLAGSPSNYWEILWTVTIERTGAIYTGGYNTTLTFVYEESSSWSLVHEVNMLNNSLSCQECRQFGHFDDDYFDDDAFNGTDDRVRPSSNRKPKPKPKPKPGPDVKVPDAGSSNSTSVTTDYHTNGYSGYDDDEVIASGGLRVSLFSTGNKYFKSNREGTNYFISDSSREELVAQGTVCEDFTSRDCAVFLRDGSYYFRMASALDDDKDDYSWSFCGASGVAGEELAFYVENGLCYPMLQETVNTICTTSITTSVTLEGSVKLSGVSSDPLMQHDEVILQNALLDLFLPSTQLNITQSYSSLTAEASILEVIKNVAFPRKLANAFQALYTDNRKLFSGDVSFDFIMTVLAEDYGYSGTNYEQLDELRDYIGEVINASFAGGANSSFQHRVSMYISNMTLGANDTALSAMDMETLLQLQITHYNYHHETALLDMLKASKETGLSSSTVGVVGLTVGASLVLGTIALLLYVKRSNRMKNKIIAITSDDEFDHLEKTWGSLK